MSVSTEWTIACDHGQPATDCPNRYTAGASSQGLAEKGAVRDGWTLDGDYDRGVWTKHYCPEHKPAVSGPCREDVSGTVPSWAGEDQISPCRCVLDKGHDGGCKCSHQVKPESHVEGSDHG